MDSKLIIKSERTNYPNLYSICRLCLKENVGSIDIFDPKQSLVIRIFTCTAIEVQSTSSTAKFICENCRIDLEKSYYFRKRSQICNDKLKKHLRLINAGKISKVFDNNVDNEDDEIELEESIKFLKEIEKKENEKRENELQKRMQTFKENFKKELSEKVENELEKRIQTFKENYEKKINEKIKIESEDKLETYVKNFKLKYDNEIAKLKNDYEKKLQHTKERFEKMKNNLRTIEVIQIINDMKNFLDAKTAENYKKPRILNTEINNDDKCKTMSSINKEIIIKQKSQKRNSLENKMTIDASSSSLMDVEMFNIELHPPKKLFKCTYDENDENIKDKYDYDGGVDNTITDENQCENNGDNDYDDENVEVITGNLFMIDNENKTNIIDRSKNENDEDEIIEENHETNYEIIESECNEEHVNDDDRQENNQAEKYNLIDMEDYSNSLNDDGSTEIETFHENIEEQMKLIKDESLHLHDNDNDDNESNNADQKIKNIIKESLVKEGIKIEDDAQLDIKKISKRITQVKTRTKEGKLILMEVRTEDTTSAKSNTKTEKTTFETVQYDENPSEKNDENDENPSEKNENLKATINESVKIFRCKLCPQAFSRQTLLLRHKSVHEKRRGYACEYCEKWFACSSSLNRHKRIHTGEKPFCCKECGKYFIQKEILTRHMLVHTGERPYKCPHCDRSYQQKPLLTNHINQKHTKNPILELHECHLCSKSFMHASGLSRHLLTHVGLVFTCAECGREFTDKSALKRHQVSHVEK